ncbi:hypothetical protein GFS60_06057 [Rhodococcus sp. WAY2]|nr:hypothetical protein GFS60_06057 [Rhodococcus sp. WAY2]
MTLGGGLDGALPHQMADIVDSDERMNGFVGVDSEHDQRATPIQVDGL